MVRICQGLPPDSRRSMGGWDRDLATIPVIREGECVSRVRKEMVAERFMRQMASDKRQKWGRNA